MKYLISIALLLLSFSIIAQEQEPIAQKKVLKLMGSRFEITAVAQDKAKAWAAINAGIQEIERIEKLISSWDPNSQTSAINRSAGKEAVKVDKELFDLIFRAQKISNLTNGAFDISFASMDPIWKFDGSMTQMPSDKIIKEAKANVNWENIELDMENQTVFLKEEGMKIGFGAIGKGYAANKAKYIMKEMEGVSGGLVNASGDLISWGVNVGDGSWLINITNPKEKELALGWLRINDMSVVTSGNYEKFVMFNGKRYAHIIDPLTGYPTKGVKSVTVVCSDAELADALATSIFVLGKEKGMRLVNQLKDIECLIVSDKDEILTSKNLKINYF